MKTKKLTGCTLLVYLLLVAGLQVAATPTPQDTDSVLSGSYYAGTGMSYSVIGTRSVLFLLNKKSLIFNFLCV